MKSRTMLRLWSSGTGDMEQPLTWRRISPTFWTGALGGTTMSSVFLLLELSKLNDIHDRCFVVQFCSLISLLFFLFLAVQLLFLIPYASPHSAADNHSWLQVQKSVKWPKPSPNLIIVIIYSKVIKHNIQVICSEFTHHSFTFNARISFAVISSPVCCSPYALPIYIVQTIAATICI